MGTEVVVSIIAEPGESRMLILPAGVMPILNPVAVPSSNSQGRNETEG